MQDIDVTKKHNKILKIMLVLCLVIILVLMSIILLNDKDTSNLENPATASEMITIETPYCNLEYPSQTADLLKCVDKEENGTYSKVFYGCVDGQEIELFEISFGVKENAVLIGYIMHDGTKCPVFVRSAEIDSNFDTDSQNTIYMMQEGINDVIQSITSNENYLAE